MGVYLDPGYLSFEEAVNSNIYVDKSEMILFINSVVKTKQKYVSVSRPRRFGKSMAAEMLCAYYGREDSRFLFEQRKLAKKEGWDMYLGKFHVIRVVMTDFIKRNGSVGDGLLKMQRLIVRELKKKYPDVDFFDTDDLIQSMLDVYAETEKQFVIVIDEWDAVFRLCKEAKEEQIVYLNFLRD